MTNWHLALTWVDAVVPLAQSRIELLHEAFELHSSNSRRGLDMMATVAVVVLLGLAVRWWFLLRDRRQPKSIDGVFVELCRAHHLNRAHQKLLRQWASHRGVENPSLLFLDASLWETGDDLPVAWRKRRVRGRMTMLYRMLFEVDT
ncbi:MAG: hypothetical protein KatS3mg111_2674 [Pirellulaceae bacterium]|nr:MAG: hypothetical protein KatS3mg111_2674 [Pirellulaceae bacterium]